MESCVIALAAGKSGAPIAGVPAPNFSPPTRITPRRLWRRIAAHWVLKMIGTTALMSGFFCAYFQLLNHPAFPVATMPLLAVDHWIRFQPAAVVLYVSLWLYVPLAPALVTELRELWSYGVATFALGAVGLGIFFFWPTAVPPGQLQSEGWGIAWLRGVDAAGNACPSLHVAYALFTAVWFERLLRQMQAGVLWRWGNVLWGGGVIYSTLAVKQHVALDVLAGAALGGAAVAAHLAWLRRTAGNGGVAPVSAATRNRA